MTTDSLPASHPSPMPWTGPVPRMYAYLDPAGRGGRLLNALTEGGVAALERIVSTELTTFMHNGGTGDVIRLNHALDDVIDNRAHDVVNSRVEDVKKKTKWITS